LADTVFGLALADRAALSDPGELRNPVDRFGNLAGP
jgi:hypothetical protein